MTIKIIRYFVRKIEALKRENKILQERIEELVLELSECERDLRVSQDLLAIGCRIGEMKDEQG